MDRFPVLEKRSIEDWMDRKTRELSKSSQCHDEIGRFLAFAVKDLPLGAKIEIECIAVCK